MNALQENSLVSIKHVASRLDLSIRAVYRLIARREFPPPIKVGGASKFYESDINGYLNRLKAARKSG